MACYRAWLFDYGATGACSPEAHLAGLGLALTDYPAAFPWLFYARAKPSVGSHRWAALDDFVAAGFEAGGERIPYGESAYDFLAALARAYAGRRDDLSIRAFELAGTHVPLSGPDRQHLADSHLRQRQWS